MIGASDTAGASILANVRSHVPSIATVSYTSGVPENDIGNHSGLHIRGWMLQAVFAIFGRSQASLSNTSVM